MDHFTFLCVNLFSAVLLVCWWHLKKSDKSGIFATIPSFYRSICLRVCIFKLLFIFHWDVIGQMETVLLKKIFFNLDYFSWSRFWPGLWRLFTCIEHMYNICHHHIRFYSDNLHRNFFPPLPVLYVLPLWLSGSAPSLHFCRRLAQLSVSGEATLYEPIN